MLCRGAEARAYHGANHNRRNRLTAEHVTKLCRLVINLIETDAHEIDKHQFDHRTQSRGRGSDRGSHKSGFSDWGVHDTVPKRFPQPFRDSEDSTPRVHFAVGSASAGNILAHDDDGLV